MFACPFGSRLYIHTCTRSIFILDEEIFGCFLPFNSIERIRFQRIHLPILNHLNPLENFLDIVIGINIPSLQRVRLQSALTQA